MGITLCENVNTHASVSYDIQTIPQGIIFISYGIFCTLCEALFMFFTIRFFCADLKAFSRIYFVLFYLSFHLSLLSSILYFTGGFVCYGLVLYNAIANFSYLFQGIGVYAVTMEMLDSLTYIAQIEDPSGRCRFGWCFPLILCHCVAFLAIFCVEICEEELHYFYLYNMMCHLALASCFFGISKRLYEEMSHKYPSFVSPSSKSAWVSVAYTVMILMIVRAMLALLNFMGFTFYLKTQHIGLFTLYIIAFITLFDLVPCMTLTIFMQTNMKRNIKTKSISEIKSELNRKSFATMNDNELGEEMVDENASDDWVQ